MPSLRLVSVDTGQVLEIQERGVVGRQPGVAAQIAHDSVSRQHAVIEYSPQGWTIRDSGSSNGTWIGEERVSASRLDPGTIVRFGAVRYRVELPADHPTTLLPAVDVPPPAPPPAPVPRAAARTAPPELPPTLRPGSVSSRPAPPRVASPQPPPPRPAAPSAPAAPARMNVAPAPVSTTGVLDFNALPERARQHLVDCLAGRAEPRLLASHNKDTGVAGPIAALPIVGLPLVGLLALQLGRPGDAWLGWTALFVLGPLVFGFILACLAIAYRLIRSRALPFPEGRFLFPLDVVETGWSVARWPILSAEKVDVVHQTNQGRYVSTFLTFKFPGRGALRFELRPRDRAEAALATLREAQNAVREAQSLGVPQALARLDPLAEV